MSVDMLHTVMSYVSLVPRLLLMDAGKSLGSLPAVMFTSLLPIFSLYLPSPSRPTSPRPTSPFPLILSPLFPLSQVLKAKYTSQLLLWDSSTNHVGK